MKSSLPLLFALAASLIFAGCATQTKEQLAAVRAAKVSPVVVNKLEHWGSLTPADLIELKRRHVDDGVAIRQLDRAGVDYVLNKADVKRMQAAGVSDAVIQAAIRASNRFVSLYYYPYPGYAFGWYPYYTPWAYTIPSPPILYPPRGGPGGGPPPPPRR